MAIASGVETSAAQTGTAPGQARYIIGKPYQFDGVWYRPAPDYGYDQTGVASVYPPSMAGLATTSGESYDANALSAAHKTLPLPSIALVTNLDNGKSVELRINDRGPFVDDKIIELTPAAAQSLGVSGKASAHVRVQIVAQKSKALAASLGGNESTAEAGSLPAVPPPAVKVSGLPLLSDPAVQPVKPVAAPTVPEPVASSATPTVPAAATVEPAPDATGEAPPPPVLAVQPAQPTPVDATESTPALPEPVVPTPLAAAEVPAAPPEPVGIPTLPEPVVVAQPAPLTPAPAVPLALPIPTTSVPATTIATEPAPAPAPSVTASPPVSSTTSNTSPPPSVSATVANTANSSGAVAPAPGGQLASVPPEAPAQGAIGEVTQPTTTDTKPLPIDLPAQFFIQTGAFKAKAEADKLRAKLAGLGPTKIVPTRLGDQNFNAVLLGPIPSMNEAQKLLKQMNTMGYSDAVLLIQ